MTVDEAGEPRDAATLQLLTGDDLPDDLVASILAHCPGWLGLGPRAPAAIRSNLMEVTSGIDFKLAVLRTEPVPISAVDALDVFVANSRGMKAALLEAGAALPQLIQSNLHAWWQAFELERIIRGSDRGEGSVKACRCAALALHGGTWISKLQKSIKDLPASVWQQPLANPARVIIGPWLTEPHDSRAQDLDAWAYAAEWQILADEWRATGASGKAVFGRRKLCYALDTLGRAGDADATTALMASITELGCDYMVAGDCRSAIASFSDVLVRLNGIRVETRPRMLFIRARTLGYLASALRTVESLDKANECYRLAIDDFRVLVDRCNGSEYRNGSAFIHREFAGLLASEGRHLEAFTVNESSLRMYDQLIDLDGHTELLPIRAAALSEHATILSALGRPRDAISKLNIAINDYELILAKDDRAELRHECALLRGRRGDVKSSSGSLDEALQDYEQALSELGSILELPDFCDSLEPPSHCASEAVSSNDCVIDLQQSLCNMSLPNGGLLPGELRLARAKQFLKRATALMSWGRFDDAVKDTRRSLEGHVELLNAEWSLKDVLPNLAQAMTIHAHALSRLGRNDLAVDFLDSAISYYTNAIEDLGLGQCRRWRTRAGASRAAILNAMGRTDDAIAGFEACLSEYKDLIASEAPERSLPLQILQAWTQMSCSNAMMDARSMDETISSVDTAIAQYTALVERDSQEQLRERIPQAMAVRAMALLKFGRPQEAYDCIDQALRAWDTLVEVNGRVQLRAHRARMLALSARARVNQGLIPEATNGYERAVEEYHQLLDVEGQWANLDEGVETVAAAWVFAMGSNSAVRAELHTQRLRHWLNRAPLDRGHCQHTAMTAWLRYAQIAWATSAVGTRAGRDPTQQTLWKTHWQTLLDWASDLLREPSTEWLHHKHGRDRLQSLLTSLFDLAAVQGPQEVSRWFLQTQSLRAQRAALVQDTDDADILVWRELWVEHDALVTELLLQHGTPMELPGIDGPDASSNDGAFDRSPAAQEQAHVEITQRRKVLDAKRIDCRHRLDQLRQDLVDGGRLPAQQSLDLEQLPQALVHGQGLLMLTPLPSGKGWLAQVIAHAGGDPAIHHQSFTLSDTPELESILAGADRSLSLALGMRSVRDGAALLEEPAGPQESSEARRSLADAHALHQGMAEKLLPALEQLVAWGCTGIAVIPAGALHTVPWLHLLRSLPDAPHVDFSLYPSAAAWWQASLSRQAARALRLTACAPRIGTLVHDALLSPAPLPWVHLELALVREIWAAQPDGQWSELSRLEPRWPPASALQAPINCLVAAGHSADQDGSGVRAGLLLGKDAQGRDRVFTGYELPKVRHAKRLLLSCCTLGKVGDTLGEAHGLVSTAFAFQTEFASGSLVKVGDVEAALFSIAFHWSLRAAYEKNGEARAEPSWAHVFLETQDRITSGRWPDGLSALTSDRLPALALELWQTKPASCSHTRRTWQEAWGAQLWLQASRYAAPAMPDEWKGSAGQVAALHVLARSWSEIPPPSLQELARWLVCIGE